MWEPEIRVTAVGWERGRGGSSAAGKTKFVVEVHRSYKLLVCCRDENWRGNIGQMEIQF